MELLFIRHTSVAVAPGVCYGSSDVPVSSHFEQEAELVRARLKGITFDQVFASPLSRATKLAHYCGYEHPVIDKRVCEVDYGQWEMKSFSDIPSEEIQPWYDNWRTVRPPQGESFHDEFLRVKSFIDEVKQHPWERVAVFCHGGVLICAAIYSGLFDFNEVFPRHFDYGEVLSIKVD